MADRSAGRAGREENFCKDPTHSTTRRFPMPDNGLRALGRRQLRRVRQVMRRLLSRWPRGFHLRVCRHSRGGKIYGEPPPSMDNPGMASSGAVFSDEGLRLGRTDVPRARKTPPMQYLRRATIGQTRKFRLLKKNIAGRSNIQSRSQSHYAVHRNPTGCRL